MRWASMNYEILDPTNFSSMIPNAKKNKTSSIYQAA